MALHKQQRWGPTLLGCVLCAFLRPIPLQELARKHGVPPERLGLMQSQLRVELDELIVAAEALPLVRQKEKSWRLLAEKVVGELSAVRRRCVVCVCVQGR